MEGWDGVELPLAGPTLTLSMRNTLSVDFQTPVTLPVNSPPIEVLLCTGLIAVGH